MQSSACSHAQAGIQVAFSRLLARVALRPVSMHMRLGVTEPALSLCLNNQQMLPSIAPGESV